MNQRLFTALEVLIISGSPNSQWFAYDAKDEVRTDIFIVNIYDSDNPIRLTDTGDNFSPQWRP
jgi:Tol biopolymer transport system component